jgi:hypothetical protein
VAADPAYYVWQRSKIRPESERLCLMHLWLRGSLATCVGWPRITKVYVLSEGPLRSFGVIAVGPLAENLDGQLGPSERF